MYDGTTVPTCGQYVIRVGPGPGKGASGCDGASCTFSCDTTTGDDAAWSYQRLLSTTTSATLILNKRNDCCECVPRKWHDELSFWRVLPDGSLQKKPKWIGPVVDVIDDETTGSLTINAKDRSVWLLEEWIIQKGFSQILEPAEARFERLIKLATLGTLGLSLVRLGGVDLSGINISDDVADWTKLGPELQKLQGFGIQWAVIGDEIVFGRLSDRLTSAIIDPSVHWVGGGAIVSDLGSTSISNLVVKGEGFDPVAYPETISFDPCEGAHVDVVEPSFELTEETAALYARQEFERRSAQGLSIATSVDSSVSEDWPISVCDMRPGGTVEIDTSDEQFCLNAKTEATLTESTFEGVGCEEKSVKVTLAPASTVQASLL